MDQRDNQVTLQAKEEKQAQLNEMMNPKVTIGAVELLQERVSSLP